MRPSVLMRDDRIIEQPVQLETLTQRYTEEAVRFIGEKKEAPFFLYLAFGATHAPHQAPPEYLERWRGRFNDGYDAARERWFARQIEIGVVPPGTTLAPRKFSARLQEAFAAMLEHTDTQVGRLVDFLETRGLLDDTLLMVLSDNGASREGGPFGVMDEFSRPTKRNILRSRA